MEAALRAAPPGRRTSVADHGRNGGDAAGRALRSAADRLLLRMAWRGAHWTALLAITSIAGAIADTLLPAVAGHTVDVVLGVAVAPGAAPGAASHTAYWLAGCTALIVVIVSCGALGQFAAGMSTAAATEWLRHRLAGRIFACGLRLPGRAFWRIQARVAAQGSVIIPLLQVAVLGVAGMELAAHRISPGELLAASQYAVIGAGVGASIGRLSQLARARAGARRVADPLGEPVTAQGARLLPPGRGCLELRGVTVLSGGERVLDSVDIAIPGGAGVAVVGRSGAG